MFDRLEQMAADPANGRTLRKLDHPGEVTFKYTGIKTAGEGALKADGAGVFSGEITGLQEDVLFTVRAEDFHTPQRAITRVPPPSLTSLRKVEYQPAYLHYASPLIDDPNNPGQQVIAGYAALKPYNQQMKEEGLTLTGNRTPMVVPAGTEVVITGTTEKPIKKAYGVPKVGRFPGAKVTIVDGKELRSNEPVELPLLDENTFTVEFRGEQNKITGTVEFDFLLVNEDGLQTKREMMIQITEDQAPVAEVLPEVIPQGREGLLGDADGPHSVQRREQRPRR